MESRLEKTFSMGINMISLAVWLGEDRKCSAAVLGLDLLLGFSMVQSSPGSSPDFILSPMDLLIFIYLFIFSSVFNFNLESRVQSRVQSRFYIKPYGTTVFIKSVF